MKFSLIFMVVLMGRVFLTQAQTEMMPKENSMVSVSFNPLTSTGINLAEPEEEDKMKYFTVRLGAGYYDYSPYRNGNINTFSNDRFTIPSIQPFLGVAYVVDGIGITNCCDFLVLQVFASINKNEFHKNYPYQPKPSEKATPSIFYTSISGQYGRKLGERWRLGPVVSVNIRSGSIIDNNDKKALSSFGIYDLNKDKFNNNFKVFDVSLGASVMFKFTHSIFIQGDLNYGLIPQITLPGKPNVYQTSVSLALGYVIKQN